MSTQFEKIKPLLPYSQPFLFVDNIVEVSDDHIIGEYTYKMDEWYLHGHFINNPIIPGAIILETMGQVGLVCLAIHLNNYKYIEKPLLSYTEMELFYTLKPGDKVIVTSEKIYFRNNILKCKIVMLKEDKLQVATLNGILNIS